MPGYKFAIESVGRFHQTMQVGLIIVMCLFCSVTSFADNDRAVGVVTLVPGPYFISELSGYQGGHTFLLRDAPLSDNEHEDFRLRRALFGFEWNEVADHPCEFTMFEDFLPHRFEEATADDQPGRGKSWLDVDRESQVDPNQDTLIHPWRVTWKRCAAEFLGSDTRPRNAKRAASFQEGRYVYGIQVCTPRSSRRIKGLKIITREVGLEGDPMTGVEVDIPAKRANCKKWHARVTCDGNSQIGVGVVLHVENYSDENARRANIVGLNLLCANYVTAPWPDETPEIKGPIREIKSTPQVRRS